MHVLIIPSWFPSRIVSQKGIFIKKQAEALVSKDIKMGVVYTELCSMRQNYNEGPISVEVSTSLITLYSEILNPVESS